MNMDTTHQRAPPSTHQDEDDDEEIIYNKNEHPAPAWEPRTVSIEPVLFLYLLAGGLSWPTFNALLYHKVCASHFDNYTCNNLHNKTFHEQEDAVQTMTSHWFLWHNYVYEIPGILLAIGYGSLSDHVSRRLTIVLPVAGQILCNVVYLISAIYMDSPVVYTLIGGIINGVSGGWITLFMACFSYLSESCSQKDRTKRVFIAEALAGVSISIALVSSGFLLEHTNYTTVFSVIMGLYTMCVIYIMSYIKEPPRKQLAEEKGKQSCILFLHRMKSALLVVFKKRENNGRARVIVTMSIVLTSMISGNAVYTVGYLYLKRSPLSWTQSYYGMFTALNSFVPSAVLFIITWVKVKYKFRDTSVMIFGLASHCLSEFWFSFCTHTWMVFLMPFIACLRSGETVSRSILSQLVPAHELGKMFAVLGALQSLSGLVGSTLYNTIYPQTLDFWPGFCFTLGTAIAIVPAILTGWLHYDLTRLPIYDKQLGDELVKVNRYYGDQDPLLYGATDDELNEEEEDGIHVQKETVIT